MREILFRAKTLSNGWKEGFIGYTKDPLGTQIFWTEYVKNEPFTKKDYVLQDTIGQYTGLTDKDGAKIFEGDIVEAGYYKWKCEVVWDRKSARFICFTMEGERKIVYVDMVDKNDKSVLEVIGNVHDNPELRKEEPT